MIATDGLEWMESAACKGLTDLFFPVRGDNTGFRQAQAVCAGCPVREQCLTYAIENSERVGTWGGKSERQRRRTRLAASEAAGGRRFVCAICTEPFFAKANSNRPMYCSDACRQEAARLQQRAYRLRHDTRKAS